MNIANMIGTSTTSALEALYGDSQNKKKQEFFSSFDSQGDTVSLSREALDAYAAMYKKSSESDASEDHTLSKDTADAGQGASGGSASGSGNSVEDIQDKIKELQQKMAQIQSSGVPEETKEAMTSGIQAQINALTQELQALKAQAK